MDSNQPTANPSPAYAPPSPGFFGTAIPSSVALVIAVLLFLLPLTEIKCGGTTILSKNGLQYAMGKEWKASTGLGKETMGETTSKANDKKEGNAQYFAIAAMALGIISLLLALSKSKNAVQSAILTSVLAAGAMIMLMLDVKKWFKEGMAKQAADKTKEGGDSLGLDKMSDNINLNLSFTTWYYVALIAFLAAAFFCFKRIQSDKSLK
jgi:hypothetical protein